MKQQKLHPQHLILICVFGLVVFGLAILSSASAIIAYKNFDNNDYYFWNQAFNIVLGFVGMIIASQIHYRKWIEYTPFFMVVILILLVAVFIPGIRNEYGTSYSWINLPNPLPNIQPAEFAKLTLILYLAFLFDRKKALVEDFKEGLLPFVVILTVFCGLLALQPDFGTIFIIVAISLVMFFGAGGRISHIILMFTAGTSLAMAVIVNKQYIYNRFTAFLNPYKDELGTGYHIIQSLIAVGSGGFFGKGFGASRFKYEGYLPEAQGDSIFAIASEELGFIRVALIVLAFAVIAWQGIKVAQNAKDNYGKYLAIGIVSWITLQAFINMMVVLSLFPTTGITLPFISYGGSSLLATLFAVGILLNIAKHEQVFESRDFGRGDGGTYHSRPLRSKSPYRRALG